MVNFVRTPDGKCLGGPTTVNFAQEKL